jgi:succinate dehydrogenase / fumarate reductase cytochrome b subunit
VITAFQVYAEKKRARPEGYAVTKSKGGPSRMTTASKSMIYTGIILLLFIPAHIWMFKFNAGRGFEEHMTTLHDTQVKDLYAVVVNAFSNPLIAFGYAAVMFLLGLHLRHGFWSSIQSLGARFPACSKAIYCGGFVFAVLLAGGFFILPIYFYFASCMTCSGGAL